MSGPPPIETEPWPAPQSTEPIYGAPPPPVPAPPTPPRPPLRRRRPPVLAVALIALLPVATLLVYELVVTNLMYSQRQQHLAADFAVPRAAAAGGQAYGVLQIPSIDLNEMVIEGDGVTRLESGPAHRPSATRPGQPGNVVILGHRTRFGGPFGRLGDVKTGDAIFLQDKRKAVTEFHVICTRVVPSGDSALLAETDQPHLVLITAGSGALPSRRRVVIASADPDEAADCPSDVAGPDTETGSLEPYRGSLIINRNAILLYLTVLVAVVLTRFLRRRRYPIGVTALVLAPVVVYGALMALTFLDRLLPGTL